MHTLDIDCKYDSYICYHLSNSSPVELVAVILPCFWIFVMQYSYLYRLGSTVKIVPCGYYIGLMCHIHTFKGPFQFCKSEPLYAINQSKKWWVKISICLFEYNKMKIACSKRCSCERVNVVPQYALCNYIS